MLKFTCPTETLMAAINMVSRTVALRSTIPALEGIFISAGTKLNLTGYNLETGVTVALDAETSEMGSAVFPAKLFGDIVRKLPGETVTIAVSDGFQTKIQSGISSFSIMSTAGDDYPELPDVEYDKGIQMPQEVLKDMISRTIFSVSENKARPIQTGCKFEIDAETVTVIAVDGFRLALRREKIENPDGRTLNFVVPAPALRELEKILTDTDDPVTFTLGTRHILFEIGNATLVCRLLEGEFLDWRRVVPTDNTVQIGVHVKTFTESLDRVSLIVSEKLKSPVRCTFGENLVTLRTSNSMGTAYDECQTAGSGGDLEIGFNCKYILDAFRAVPTEEVTIALKNGLSPAVILPCESFETFTYMVLPVRLKAE